MTLRSICTRYLKLQARLEQFRDWCSSIRAEMTFLSDCINWEVTHGNEQASLISQSESTYRARVGSYLTTLRFGRSVNRINGEADDQIWLNDLRGQSFNGVSFQPYVRIKYELNKQKIRRDYLDTPGILGDEHLTAMGIVLEPTVNVTVEGTPTEAEMEDAETEMQKLLPDED